jgi:alpha-glucosidase
MPGIPSRNLFGALWARATRRCGEKDGMGPNIALIRGSGIGGQSASMPWPGDTRFGQDAFIEDVWFAMAAGLAGFPIVSADLGGFMASKSGAPGGDNPFDTDNLARRLCQGIMVIPNPRMHQSDSHPAKFPWNCPPRIRPLYKAMLIERYRLIPYYFSWAIHACRTGEPIARPLWYSWPTDRRALTCQDQLLIGESLMAAPVFERGATARDVYLPPGKWYCFWSGREHQGGRTISVKTPMFNVTGLPMFVKAGAIIPRQRPTPFLRDELPAALELDVYPAGSTRFNCHESEEVTHRFACSEENGRIALTVPNLTGRVRTYRIRLHVGRKPVGIQVNSVPFDARRWIWSPARRVTEFEVRVQPER